MAVAMCSEYGITPRELYTQGHVPELQQSLLKWDATIPNVKNQDEADQARRASVTASREIVYGVIGTPTFEKIAGVAGVELWDFMDRIDTCDVLLRNTSDQDVELGCDLEHFVPDHPWQYHGERNFFDYYTSHNEVEWGSEKRTSFYQNVATVNIIVPAGFEGYLTIPFYAKVTAKNPITDDDRMTVVLRTEVMPLRLAAVTCTYLI